MADLTDKQRRFVDGVLLGKLAGVAYRDAGYKAAIGNSSDSAASRLLRNVKIQEAIAEGRRGVQQRTAITVDWIVNKLHEEAEYRGEGASHSARVKATELLGKHIGMWPDKPPAGNLSFTEVYDFSGLTHERLTELRSGVRSLLASRLERRAVGDSGSRNGTGVPPEE